MADGEDLFTIQLLIDGKPQIIETTAKMVECLNSSDPMIRHQSYGIIAEELKNSGAITTPGTIQSKTSIDKTMPGTNTIEDAINDSGCSTEADAEEENNDCCLLKLPADILQKIVKLVLALDESCQLCCVSQYLRDIVYNQRSILFVKMSVLKSNSTLFKKMPNLKRLHVKFDCDSVELFLSCMKESRFKNLVQFTLQNLKITRYFPELVETFSEVCVTEVNCQNCEHITPKMLEHMLQRMPSLKCCNVDVLLSSDESMIQFAMLANKLAGKVNLSINSIEQLPQHLLEYPICQYRVFFPTGQFF